MATSSVIPRSSNFLAFAVLAAIMATNPMAHRPAAAEEDMTVRLGYQFSLWSLPAVVALEMGLFEKHGLKIEARRFGAGAEARNGIIGGSIDVATVGGAPFVAGAATGELVAIGVVSYNGRTGCIMVKKGSDIRSVTDLKGHKIASRTGSTIDTVLINKILPAHGMTTSDVELANVNFPDHVASVAGGSTIGFAGNEPSCTIAEAQGIAENIVTDFDRYDMLPNMITVAKGWAEENPKTAKAVIAAFHEAGELIRSDPDQVVDILQEFYGRYNLSPDYLKRMLLTADSEVDYRPGLGAYFADQLSALHKLGRVPVAEIDWDEILDTSALRAVLR